MCVYGKAVVYKLQEQNSTRRGREGPKEKQSVVSRALVLCGGEAKCLHDDDRF